jgi:hypothetical protein
MFYISNNVNRAYVVRAIGSPVRMKISNIRKRRMKQNIPQIGDETVRNIDLVFGRTRKRCQELNNLLHLFQSAHCEKRGGGQSISNHPEVRFGRGRQLRRR